MTVTIKPKIDTKQTRLSKKSRKIYPLIWAFKNADFSSTNQKDLKLGQCLDIDDMTSPSKFGEVT